MLPQSHKAAASSHNSDILKIRISLYVHIQSFLGLTLLDLNCLPLSTKCIKVPDCKLGKLTNMLLNVKYKRERKRNNKKRKKNR